MTTAIPPLVPPAVCKNRDPVRCHQGNMGSGGTHWGNAAYAAKRGKAEDHSIETLYGRNGANFFLRRLRFSPQRMPLRSGNGPPAVLPYLFHADKHLTFHNSGSWYSGGNALFASGFNPSGGGTVIGGHAGGCTAWSLASTSDTPEPPPVRDMGAAPHSSGMGSCQVRSARARASSIATFKRTRCWTQM